MKDVVNGDPTNIAQVQAEIAKFTIPPGYKPFAINMFNYNMVTLTPVSSKSGMMIMLMQYRGLVSGNSEQMEEQLRQAVERQSNQSGTSMQVVDMHEEIIRKQTVTVTISEGQYQTFTMRQWSAVFKGNNGPTILMVQGAVETWNKQLLEDFIKSIN